MIAANPPMPAANYGSPTAIPKCLYCTGQAFDPLYSGIRDRLQHVPGEHTLWKCRQCNSAILVPMPAENELAAFYPDVYNFTPDTPQSSPLKKWLARLEYNIFFQPQYFGQALQVLNHIGRRPADQRKLLDIGCGRGLRLLEYRKRGWEVHGADLQPEVVRYLNEDLKIPAKTGGFSEVRQLFPAQSFDLVTSAYTFEHIPDVDLGFRLCWDLLKPGGWIAVLVPLIDSAQAKLFGKNWVSIAEAPRHLNIPTQSGIEAACRRIGYESVKTLHDHPLGIAGAFALSAVPASNSTQLYGQGGGLRPLFFRALGSAAILVGLGLAFLDRWQGNIPCHGLIMGRKPLN
jgi:SAM-dependent methyltransferase